MADTSHLTDRQLQVLQCIHEGMQNKEIAYALGISIYTVKEHTVELYRRLGIPGTKYGRVLAALWYERQH